MGTTAIRDRDWRGLRQVWRSVLNVLWRSDAKCYLSALSVAFHCGKIQVKSLFYGVWIILCENYYHSLWKMKFKSNMNCCVPQCTAYHRNNPELSFHGFPSNEVQRKRWIHVLKIGKKPSKHAKVCSRHFRSKNYKTLLSAGEDFLTLDGLTATACNENMMVIKQHIIHAI